MLCRNRPVDHWTLVFAMLLGSVCIPTMVQADLQGTARQILDSTGFSGGLVVHVDCGDGVLTAALRANDHTIVHGLDRDPVDVSAARKHIRSMGNYGTVSIERWQGPGLPYADNTVNLLVAAEGTEISREEMMRVLCPGGQGLVLGRSSEDSAAPTLTKFSKPWPSELDQWTHFLHDPGNNAVAKDQVVGPPGRMQWMAGPVWSKEHDVTPSVFSPVSCGGRLFYILNEGPVCTIGEGVPDRYSVVARDAFNGIVLWKRPMTDWFSTRVIWGHIPMHSQRRLVAVGDRVYVTLGLQAPVTALDAVTGEVVQEYAGTEHTSEIVSSNGRLALVTRKMYGLDGLLAGRDGNRFRKGYTGPQEGSDEVLVVGEATGECLWRSRRRCMPMTLAVVGQRVLFAEKESVACLDLDTGEPLWTVPLADVRTLVVEGETVFGATADPKKVSLTALDLATGERLWSREGGSLPNFLFFFGPLDVFVARGLVWGMAEGLEWNKRPGSGHVLGLDPRTGEVRQRIPLSGAFTTEHHVRCYKGKATEDYLLFNKRGIEFINLVKDEAPVPNSYQWVRGTCRYGILPCNGLIYAPPHACACFPGAKVDGFWALASSPPAWTVPDEAVAGVSRLTKGPAYGKSGKVAGEGDLTKRVREWPTYRHDEQRSGCTASLVPADPRVAWEVELDCRPTSPVVAEGVVLAAATDEYTLHAWDAKKGAHLWSYTAGGRIDSPPTVHDGTAIFGCRDGFVYCVRLGDGELVWRFRAAPRERRVTAFGRMESAWPVHGSVLVNDGVAYFAAGRSSFLDGGIYVYGVEARTGELRFETRLSGPDPQAETSRVSSGRMPGAVPDIMSCDDTGLYLRHVKLDWQLTPPAPEQFNWGIKGETRLLAGSGFLDDTLFNRTTWRYGIRVDRSQMLAIDGTDVYGVRVYDGISWNCAIHHVGDGHLVFRQDVGKPVPRPRPEERKRLNRIPFERYAWHTRVPLRVSAMLVAGAPAKRLVVAGVPDRLAEDDPLAYLEGRRGAKLLILDAETGEQAVEVGLEAPPVWDGMAAAYDRLYVATAGGKLVCLAEGN